MPVVDPHVPHIRWSEHEENWDGWLCGMVWVRLDSPMTFSNRPDIAYVRIYDSKNTCPQSVSCIIRQVSDKTEPNLTKPDNFRSVLHALHACGMGNSQREPSYVKGFCNTLWKQFSLPGPRGRNPLESSANIFSRTWPKYQPSKCLWEWNGPKNLLRLFLRNNLRRFKWPQTIKITSIKGQF